MERVYARVSGMVQGVGFRWFVRSTAGLFGLTGWVRNLDCGDVELEAQGRPEQVARFLARVREGNRYSDVRRVEARRLEPIPEQGFEVLF